MRKLRSENGFARIPIIFRPSERASNKAAFDSAGLAPLEMLWQITHPGLESGALCDEDEQLTDSFVVVEHQESSLQRHRFRSCRYCHGSAGTGRYRLNGGIDGFAPLSSCVDQAIDEPSAPGNAAVPKAPLQRCAERARGVFS